MKGKKVLYISYDGMTDPLGQSQVIPYLKGLSQLGHSILIVSAEKPEAFSTQRKEIKALLHSANIQWHPVKFSNNVPGISAWRNYKKLQSKSFRLSKENDFDIIHCRSDIPGIIGLQLKNKFGSKLIFDMRGFWADERVEGGSWNLSNPAYRVVYNFFRKKENELIRESDAIISLTENGRQEILSHKEENMASEKITVIPCCVDLDLFSREFIDSTKQKEWKRKLQIDDDDFILSYSGSLGTWYLLEEMLKFFALLGLHKPKAKFLFITKDSKEKIQLAARKMGIPDEKILVIAGSRNEMPVLLSLSDASVFFIKNSFSKKASSPTKMGELMALGIPVISNSGVGDVEEIIARTGSGICILSLNEKDFQTAILQLDQLLKTRAEKIVQAAHEYFSLHDGVEKYHRIYDQLV